MPRTLKRSRSGAHEECRHCGKKLRGIKGLTAHIAERHPEHALPKGKRAAE